MKKVFYLLIASICISLFTPSKSYSQYHITSHTFLGNYYTTGMFGSYGVDTMCFPVFILKTNSYILGLNFKTYWGDGSYDSFAVLNGGSFGVDTISHIYPYSGYYSIKCILFNGSIPVDSFRFNHDHFDCHTSNIHNFYYDSSGTCIPDTLLDFSIYANLKYEVDSNGIPVDTIQTTNGFYIINQGNLGDIYSYRIISNYTPGLTMVCPSSGIVYDTVGGGVSVSDIGFRCTGTTEYDLGVEANVKCEFHAEYINIFCTNNSCLPQDAILTLNFDTKYDSIVSIIPAPFSVVGNTITWHFPALRLSQEHIRIHFESSIGPITIGDTVHTSISISPSVGDIDTTNNMVIRNDTVKSSWDPNEMIVTPNGYILSGTQLLYEIDFENTGNDTAHNIYIIDTLSDFVDPKSLNVTFGSAPMKVGMYNRFGHNIVKFDFPTINLLDSSHHNYCDGMVKFTINTKSGLPNGTAIFNSAGIYFDENPVVMTNTVENIIGFPISISNKYPTSKIELYPNPANNELTIKTDGSYHFFTITNMMGQEVLLQNIVSSNTKINIKSLPAGVYYVTFKGDNNNEVRRLIKI